MTADNNNLEKYIRDHRDEFDDQVPGRSVWIGIEQKLDKGHGSRLVPFMIMKIAAMVVLVLACGVVIGVNLPGRDGVTRLDYSSSPALMQFKDAEHYYQQQVKLQLGQVKDQEAKAGVEEDLRQLDIIYQELREEMVRSGYSNSDVLINAMITNYKTRIDILENILNKQNNIKNESQPQTL